MTNTSGYSIVIIMRIIIIILVQNPPSQARRVPRVLVLRLPAAARLLLGQSLRAPDRGFFIIIIISSSSSSSSSSTQRSARGTVDEMHVFQKKVFSPRPEASVQVYFNAKTHLLRLRCKKTTKKTSLSEMHLFEFAFI